MRNVFLILFLMLPFQVNAGELVHQFSNPSFSGNGWSTHVLTIQQLEAKAKQKQKDDAEAAAAKADRELKSTNIYKFQNNLESRIYAQLSKQIADQLFGENSSGADTEWATAETPFGDTVRWRRLSDVIFVEIYDSNGSLASEFQTPVGDFAF